MTHTPIDIDALEARLDTEITLTLSAATVRTFIKAVKERDELRDDLVVAEKQRDAGMRGWEAALVSSEKTELANASLRALLAEAGDVLKPFAHADWSVLDGDNRRAASTLAAIQSALRDASPTTGKPE